MNEVTDKKGEPGPRELGERKAGAAAQKLIICQGTHLMHQACSPSGDHIKCCNANLLVYSQQQNAGQATLRTGFFTNCPEPQYNPVITPTAGKLQL